MAAAASAAIGGCSLERAIDSGEPGKPAGAAAAVAIESWWETKLLPWGTGEREVGLRPARTDLPAEGPSSVAVWPSGEVLVLDRLNERVLGIGPGGAVRERAKVARDAEHLATGTDGTIATWSPLRATVWMVGRDGAPLGEVVVPRVFRDVQRIGFESSQRVLIATAMQETLILGGPQAPLDLGDVLRSKREGAATLPDGRGVVAIRTAGGGGEIRVSRQPVSAGNRDGDGDDGGDDDRDRNEVSAWVFPIAAPVAAVRIVGTAGKAICARIERLAPASEIRVEREALCVEVDGGRVLLRRALGGPGLYTPQEDLAVGGNPAVLAVIRPEEGGLRAERFVLGAGDGAGNPGVGEKEVAR